MDSIAEHFAQMGEAEMQIALQDYTFDIKNSLDRENAKRIVRNAKGDYNTLWWGLTSFLFLADYTASRIVAQEMKELSEKDKKLQFLITNIAPLRQQSGTPDYTLSSAAIQLFDWIKEPVLYFELESGYFRRNTHSLQQEWDEILFLVHRLRSGTATYEDLYQCLLGILKFRLFIVGFMPVEVMVT